jgi:hypothetical protein
VFKEIKWLDTYEEFHIMTIKTNDEEGIWNAHGIYIDATVMGIMR